MSFIFNKMTDEELNKSELALPGIYKFITLKSSRKISKSGNEMAELVIKYWKEENKNSYILSDYLVFSDSKFCIRKIKHFCDTVGLHDEYEKGELPEKLDSLRGYLEIGVQDGNPNPNGGFYPKKNIVLDYVAKEKNEVVPIKKGLTDFDDSDIPF